MKQMIQLEEVEVFYILPAIRSRMALALKETGMKQNEIASRLCVQESTISQYLSAKRAADVKFPDSLNRKIADSAVKIRTKEDLLTETRKLLEMARNEKLTCKVHKAVADLPDRCNVCFFRR